MCVSGGKGPDKASLFVRSRSAQQRSLQKALLSEPSCLGLQCHSSLPCPWRKPLPEIGLERAALCIFKYGFLHATQAQPTSFYEALNLQEGMYPFD